MSKMLLFAASALIAVASPAFATVPASVYDFSFTNANFSTSGALTIDTSSNSGGFYNIIGITGTANGSAIAGLGTPPTLGVPGGAYTFDNLFNPSGASFFTTSGLLFSSASGGVFNIFSDGAGGYSGVDTVNGTTNYSGNISGTLNVAAVPEPSTWAMMLFGFGGIGLALRARRRPQLSYLSQLA